MILDSRKGLDPRVISTLSEEELVFPAYETNEIKEILEDRIPLAFEENSVTSGALNLCASMACREHGDARRAIKLLDVAAKTAELKQDKSITDEHIRLASQRVEIDKESQQLNAFSLHEKTTCDYHNEISQHLNRRCIFWLQITL